MLCHVGCTDLTSPNTQVAAGGTSGTGVSTTPGISQGTISGFGSLFLNGVKFDTSNAKININGKPANEIDLHVGMIGTANGSIDTSSSNGTAVSVDVSLNIIGAIDNIDLTNNNLTVVGQSVVLNTLTVFKNSTPETLKIGDVVVVSGLTNNGGQIIASYIEDISSSGSNQTELTGVIGSLNKIAKTFQIGTQLVDYSKAQFINMTVANLIDSMSVRIAGARNLNKVIVASRVENLDVGPLGEQDDVLALEGFAETPLSSSEFKLSNIKIVTTPATQFVNGKSTDVIANTRLIVHGRILEPGKLEAELVEFAVLPNITITGGVESVDPLMNRVLVSGLSVVVNNSTRMLDDSSADIQKFSLSNINIGDQLTIYGSQVDLDIHALFLRREALAGEWSGANGSVSVRGIASVPIGDPFFDIGSMTVDTSGMVNPGSFLNGSLQPITRMEFFASLQGNAFVEAEGIFVSPLLVATKAQLLSFGNMTVIDIFGSPVTGANDLVAVWDGSLNTEQDVIDGTTTVNMFVTSNQLILGFPWFVHDIRVFGPGIYTFDTCANNVTLVACDILQMTVGPNQIGAHMLLDWNNDINVDAINVWDIDKKFCADVVSPPCAIYPLAADGSIVSGLDTVHWNLVSTDYDGDGIAGGLLVDGNFAKSLTLNFNLINLN